MSYANFPNAQIVQMSPVLVVKLFLQSYRLLSQHPCSSNVSGCYLLIVQMGLDPWRRKGSRMKAAKKVSTVFPSSKNVPGKMPRQMLVRQQTEQQKMRSQLAAKFLPFFQLIAYILRQKVPYFNVLRQNRVVFNCFATKQC